MTHAPKATRGQHVTLSLGLLSVPITIFGRTAADYGINRQQFVAVTIEHVDEETGEITTTVEDHPIGYANVDKFVKETTGALVEIPRDKIEKKVATDYGYVFVSDGEVEQLFELSPNTVKIKAFVPRSLWVEGEFLPKKAYSVETTPTKVGTKKVPNKDAELILQLILSTMAEENSVAVVEMTTRGIPKACVLLPDGTLWEVHWDEEVREPRPAAAPIDVPAAYRDQVRALIRGMHKDAVALSDTRTTLIQNYAEEKAQAGDFTKPVEVEVVDAAPSVDLLAMLTASVEAAKAS
jgi:non-homologous end joining protein Ku